jgi:DNA-binding MarR family transcriptional regulator
MQEETSNSKNFGAYIDRTLKVIRLNYTQAFKRIGVDITTEQWVIMDNLYHKNGQSQNNIAEGSFKNAATVSRIIDLMCKKGITERQRFDNDRRRYKIYLTETGKSIYEKALPEVIKLREQGWKNLSDTDYSDFLRIINQVFDNFQNKT